MSRTSNHESLKCFAKAEFEEEEEEEEDDDDVTTRPSSPLLPLEDGEEGDELALQVEAVVPLVGRIGFISEGFSASTLLLLLLPRTGKAFGFALSWRLLVEVDRELGRDALKNCNCCLASEVKVEELDDAMPSLVREPSVRVVEARGLLP